MPRQVTPKTNDQRLLLLLGALERELLQASDEEVRQAAGDLGIDPDMKGSIAWLGVFYPSKVKLEDVFDMESVRIKLRQRLKKLEKPQ
jgi:hypothetical protein